MNISQLSWPVYIKHVVVVKHAQRSGHRRAGFLGLHMVERLIRDGWQVTVFDMIPSWTAEAKVYYIKGDLCKQEVCDIVCEVVSPRPLPEHVI